MYAPVKNVWYRNDNALKRGKLKQLVVLFVALAAAAALRLFVQRSRLLSLFEMNSNYNPNSFCKIDNQSWNVGKVEIYKRSKFPYNQVKWWVKKYTDTSDFLVFLSLHSSSSAQRSIESLDSIDLSCDLLAFCTRRPREDWSPGRRHAISIWKRPGKIVERIMILQCISDDFYFV